MIPKKKRNKKDPFNFLSQLFKALNEASIHYPPPDKQYVRSSIIDTEEMWKKVMILCHPDKHNNSQLSTEVSQWLIANRPKRKA